MLALQIIEKDRHKLMGKKNPNHIKSVVNSPSPYCSLDFITSLGQSKSLYLFLETFLCQL